VDDGVQHRQRALWKHSCVVRQAVWDRSKDKSLRYDPMQRRWHIDADSESCHISMAIAWIGMFPFCTPGKIDKPLHDVSGGS